LGDIAQQNKSWDEAQSHYEHALKIVESDNNNNHNDNIVGSPVNMECSVMMSIVKKNEDGIYDVPQLRRRVKRKLQKIVNDHPLLSSDHLSSSKSLSHEILQQNDASMDNNENHSSQKDKNGHSSMPIVTTIISQKPALENTLPVVQGQIIHDAPRRKSSPSSLESEDIIFLPTSGNRQRKYSPPKQTKNIRRNSSCSDISFIPSNNNNIQCHSNPLGVVKRDHGDDNDDDDSDNDDIQFAPSNNFSERDRQQLLLPTQQAMVKN